VKLNEAQQRMAEVDLYIEEFNHQIQVANVALAHAQALRNDLNAQVQAINVARVGMDFIPLPNNEEEWVDDEDKDDDDEDDA
jgi:hypothetical protein